MTHLLQSSALRSAKIRVNFVLHPKIINELHQKVPSGDRSQTVEQWIEDGLRKLKREKAFHQLTRLRNEAKHFPPNSKKNTTTLLREDRYRYH